MIVICEVCFKNRAEFHIPKIFNNKLVEIHLCKKCYAIQNHKDLTNSIEEGLNSLLVELLKSNKVEKTKEKYIKCNICGTSLRDFKESGLFGCAKCYNVFIDYIPDTFQNKKPNFKREKGKKKLSTIIENLKVKLEKAVKLENFEEAAKLRDKIQMFKNEGLADDN